MKIYYYKQHQNTFALFGKKNTASKRYYFVAVGSLFVILSFFFIKHHQVAPPKKLVANTVSSPAIVTALNTPPDVLDEETRATTLNIQRNIQSDSRRNNEEKPDKLEGPIKQAPLLKTANNDQNIIIRKHDTLDKILSRLMINKKDIAAISKLGSQAATLKKLKPGQKITVTAQNHHLTQLSYVADPINTLLINRSKDNHFNVQLKTVPLEAKQSFAKFTILGSINNSARRAGLNGKRTTQLASIFKTSIDFAKGSHTGDKVCVLFQDYFLNGKKVREGEIVAAEYKTATNTYQAVRFTDPKGNSGYYAPDGSSMQKRFLPAPVKFTRISSLFNLKRWHPILHRFRHHQGVDYAAPYGTPIKSVANGIIAQLGRQGGYGNTIMIKHDTSYSTLYGHLSKYASGLKVGAPVQQGQLIGYVGSSGLATGPHLHFEFRINGVHRNPLTVALPNGKSITHAYRNKFHNEVKKLMAKLDAHKNSSKG